MQPDRTSAKTARKAPDPSPQPPLSASSTRLLPWLIAVAFFMESLDTTILNTAVPTIAAALHVAPLSMKSVLASYTLSLAVFIPISGWMADRFGTRRVFASAIGIFTLGSFLCGISSNIHLLVAYLVDENSITATLKPVPTGQPVSGKGFGGAEEVTSAPTKPVELPAWAAGALAELKVPENFINVSDTTLPNGLRLIVKTDRTSPTVSVAGSVKHESDLETPAGQEGVSGLLGGLFSYGTRTLDRLAFQKALDDIAANESAGFGFSVDVLKEHFSRGVELLADNELHPALPVQAFAVVQKQTTQFVAGNMQSPGYRTSRALDLALLPANDPALREVTPATVGRITLDEVKQYYASTFRPDLTTIVVIGDVSSEEARQVIEKWFGEWKAAGPKPDTMLPPIPINKPSAVNVADSEAVQDSVVLAEQLKLNRFDPDYYPLQLGNHVLGGGFYATRLYHDLRQVAGYVYTVNVGLSASKTRASYSVDYGCNPENVSKARALILRDLDQMRTDDVSAAELQQAKAMLLRQIPLSESSENAVAGGLLGRAQIGLPLDEPIKAAQRYIELNADDVKGAFSRQLRIGDFVQVVRGPAPQ
jgi:zinc protease